MSRPNKPWFRAATDWWMVKIDGRQLKLAKGKKNKTAALKKFHELMAARTELPESADARVADVCEAFLAFSDKFHAPDTYRNHRFYIQSFCDVSGLLAVLELRQFHVTRWVESKKWNDTSRYNARRFVFRAFSCERRPNLLCANDASSRLASLNVVLSLVATIHRPAIGLYIVANWVGFHNDHVHDA